MTQSEVEKNNNDDELSIKDLINKFRSVIRYLKTKWLVIVTVGFIGGVIGIVYSINKKPNYTAISTFVLEEGGQGGALSQYAGLASFAGIDMGGGGGIFQGDNILELYKSRVMIEQTLLSKTLINGKQQMLIDRYIEFSHLRDRWNKDNRVGPISFSGDPKKFNRKQDSIITDLVNLFNKKVLTVAKFDKKLNIINVSVVATDELFSKEFNNKLVETVNNFYTQTKTKKSNQNVIVLQRQADSVKRVLGASISGVASSIDAAPNANPSLVSLRVPSQKRQIDVQTSTAIYSEIVKNLELAKMSLRQETPLIQVIDEPVLPLQVKKLGKVMGGIVGAVLAGFITIIVLLTRRGLLNVMN